MGVPYRFFDICIEVPYGVGKLVDIVYQRSEEYIVLPFSVRVGLRSSDVLSDIAYQF